MSVYGTDAPYPPPAAFLACRLHSTRLGASPSPRRPVSGLPPTPLDGRPPGRCRFVPRSLLGSSIWQWGGNVDPLVHRLRLWGLTLGAASPCADCHGAGTLGLPVCGVLTRICAYSFRHPHFPSLHLLASAQASPHGERSPTPDAFRRNHQDQASAGRLTPTSLGAPPLDW